MSYSPPPPKTPYGDQDFIKEDFTPPPQAQSPFAASNLRGVTYPAYPSQQAFPYGQAAHPAAYGQTAMPPAHNQQMSPAGPYGAQGMPAASGTLMTPAQELAVKMQSLTPEDRLFLRSWRQDSFYYRVLPLSAIGSGALYYYNNLKGKPHSWVRYLGVSVVSYIIGKWSYKGELRRRLETTPSNTPFIQALRQMTGVKAAMSTMGEFSGDTTQDFGATGGWNANLPAFPRARSPGEPSSFSQTPSSAYGQPSQGTYSTSDSDWSSSSPPPPGGEAPKSYTSYEELRAKNRGLIQK